MAGLSFDDVPIVAKPPTKASGSITFDDVPIVAKPPTKASGSITFDDVPIVAKSVVDPERNRLDAIEKQLGIKTGPSERPRDPAWYDGVADLGSRLYSGLQDPRKTIAKEFVASRDLANEGAQDIAGAGSRYWPGLLTNQGVLGAGKIALGTIGAGLSPLTGALEAGINSPVEKVDPTLAEGLRRGETVLPIPGLEGTRLAQEAKPIGRAAEITKAGESAVADALAPLAKAADVPKPELKPQIGEPVTTFDDLIPKAEPTKPGAEASLEPTKPGAEASLEPVDPRPRGPFAVVDAKDARALIRQRIGVGERDSATTAAALEPFQPRVNALDDAQRLAFLDAVERRSKGATVADPVLRPVADKLREEFDYRRQKLESLPATEKMTFVEDYFPHLWEDPKKAEAFLSSWGPSKQGTGANLKKRSIPTIADGLEAGLKLKTTNPLEAATMYTANMDRFIAMKEVINVAEEQGAVKYVMPGKQPEGWVELKGRASQKGMLKGYAPEDWARNYNNFISRGWAEIDPKVGQFVDTARKASNFTTMLELSLSAFHLSTMAQEAMVNELARAVGETKALSPKALVSAAKMPIAPVNLALKGSKAKAVYLGLTEGTPLEKELVSLLSQANARMTSMDKTLRQTDVGSFFKAWKQGALKAQVLDDAAQIRKAPGVAGKVGMTVAKIAKNLARVSETLQAPLFEHYIPAVKNGAAMENLKSWLELHPTASQAEKVAAAREIWDSIDNRFGEMVQDNIFWHQSLKQTAQLMMRSYSWNLGTLREIGGGALDTLKGSKGRMTSSRADYILALPLVYGFMSAVYQGLKTGEAPKDMQDLLAPRTGGDDAATGLPERAMLPGYMKDVFGWYENGPAQEAYAKLATLPRAAYELAANKDWKGDPIRGQDPHQWLQNYFDYVTSTFGPISVRQQLQGRKRGSNVSTLEQFLGIRPAPKYLTDPVGMEAIRAKLGRAADKKKLRTEMRQKALQE